MKIKFVLIFLLPIVIFIFVRLLLKQLQIKKAKNMLSRYGKDDVILFSSNVNYFGKKSAGVKQIKGNGVLLLNREELYFQMWFPKKEFRIPVSSIKSVEEVTSFLGKTKLRPLLKVNYKNKNGEIDSCVWLVGNLEEWKEELQCLIRE